jgi:hypothetical protein
MNKILLVVVLILISIIRSTEEKQNNYNELLPNIFDQEIMDLANQTDSSIEEQSRSSTANRCSAGSRTNITITPSGRKSTPRPAFNQDLTSESLQAMVNSFNTLRDFRKSCSSGPKMSSQTNSPDKKQYKFRTSLSSIDTDFTTVEKEKDKDFFDFGNQQTNWLRLSSESTPRIIYSPRHIFSGSKAGGKHHFQNFEELLAIAYLEDKNLPFVQNSQSRQLMGIVNLNDTRAKTKFSSIFPLDQSQENINQKLLELELTKPYAKGKIFGKSFQNNSLIMKFNDYFIVIDLDSTKPESLQDLFVANSIYPLFHLKAITQEDLWSTGKLIELVNYSILQEDGQWSDNFTAQITSEELNHFLRRALSSLEELKKYALGCSDENILINMPYDFAVNRINLNFDSHGQNLPRNMYRITLAISKVAAAIINHEIVKYCDVLTSV